jgi:hypothetical protein
MANIGIIYVTEDAKSAEVAFIKVLKVTRAKVVPKNANIKIYPRLGQNKGDCSGVWKSVNNK